MMTCEQCREALTDWIAGELPEEEAIGLHQHLAECRECEAEQRGLRELIGAAAPSEPWDPAAVLEEKLLARLRDLRSSGELGGGGGRAMPARSGRFPLRGVLVPSYAVIVLVVLAVAAGFWIGRSGGWRAGGEEATRGAATGRSAPSAARATQGFGFAIAPSDAVSLTASLPPDTL